MDFPPRARPSPCDEVRRTARFVMQSARHVAVRVPSASSPHSSLTSSAAALVEKIGASLLGGCASDSAHPADAALASSSHNQQTAVDDLIRAMWGTSDGHLTWAELRGSNGGGGGRNCGTATAAEDVDEAMARYVMVVDTLNFCFWPSPAFEYVHLADSVKRTMLRDRSFIDPDHLAAVDENELREHWFSSLPQGVPKPHNLGERARLLRELGDCWCQYKGKCSHNRVASAMIMEASGSASKLVEIITAHLPGFRDHTIYRGTQVFFYKRAQILVGDIWGAFSGQRLGHFSDISRLTMFPDYRVPQILQSVGILQYSEELLNKLTHVVEIPSGSEEEIEIRAGSVQAVEDLSQLLSEKYSVSVPPHVVDWLLWQHAESNLSTLAPHHRTSTIFY